MYCFFPPCLLRFKDHFKNPEEKIFKLFYWTETCIAALMHWTVYFPAWIYFIHKKKNHLTVFVSLFFIKKNDSICLVESRVLLLAVRMVLTVVAATVWTWNVFNGWQKDSHRRVFDPSRPARRVNISASQLLFLAWGSWARRRPVDLLLLLTFFLHKRPQHQPRSAEILYLKKAGN